MMPMMPAATSKVKQSPEPKCSKIRPVPQLPPLILNQLTKPQLQQFIPRLVAYATGRGGPMFDRKDLKPTWWPLGYPWTYQKCGTPLCNISLDGLRGIVQSCYRHHEREHLLLKSPSPPKSKVTVDIGPKLSPAKINLYSPSRRNFLQVFICYFCETEFMSRNELAVHQDICTAQPHWKNVVSRSSMLEKSQSHQSINDRVHYASLPRPNKSRLIQELDLVTIERAKAIKSRSMDRADIDCEIIEIDTNPQQVNTPLTPPTPKSLISQLSRDDPRQRKKSLSFSNAVLEIESDAESDSSSNSLDTTYGKRYPTTQTLLNIDISSLLGQRIEKHVKVATPAIVLSSIESVCKTPEKNIFVEKLRQREAAYPVTFRLTRKMSHYSHTYKFTRRQSRRFLLKLKYQGLSIKSIKLLKSLPRCKVTMAKLSQRLICKYTKSRKSVYLPKKCKFPPDGILVSGNMDQILGLKTKTSSALQSMLCVAAVVSEDSNAEISQQRLTLFRSLLSEFSQNTGSAKKTVESPEKTNAHVLRILLERKYMDSDLLCKPSGKGVSKTNTDRNITKVTKPVESKTKKELYSDEVVSIRTTTSSSNDGHSPVKKSVISVDSEIAFDFKNQPEKHETYYNLLALKKMSHRSASPQSVQRVESGKPKRSVHVKNTTTSSLRTRPAILRRPTSQLKSAGSIANNVSAPAKVLNLSARPTQTLPSIPSASESAVITLPSTATSPAVSARISSYVLRSLVSTTHTTSSHLATPIGVHGLLQTRRISPSSTSKTVPCSTSTFLPSSPQKSVPSPQKNCIYMDSRRSLAYLADRSPNKVIMLRRSHSTTPVPSSSSPSPVKMQPTNLPHVMQKSLSAQGIYENEETISANKAKFALRRSKRTRTLSANYNPSDGLPPAKSICLSPRRDKNACENRAPSSNIASPRRLIDVNKYDKTDLGDVNNKSHKTDPLISTRWSQSPSKHQHAKFLTLNEKFNGNLCTQKQPSDDECLDKEADLPHSMETPDKVFANFPSETETVRANMPFRKLSTKSSAYIGNSNDVIVKHDIIYLD